MNIRNRTGARFLGLSTAGVLAGALGFAVAGPADAAAQHSSFPVAGAQISCTDATYTATGGTIDSVINQTSSANGSLHVTGTDTANHITLVDQAGNTYRLVGADWFGGTLTAQGGGVTTDTNHFQIVASGGGTVDNVSVVEHFGAGSQFSFNFGTCSPPGG